MSPRADVAVIGAGFAGLSAARALVRAGASVIVLEARDRVGGRTFDRLLEDGTVLEMGGQWIGPTQKRIHSLLDELGVGTTPSFTTGDTLTDFEAQLHRHPGELPDDLGDATTAAINEAFETFDRLAATIPLDRPWTAPDARRMDETTMASWLDASVADLRARFFVRAIVESIFVRPAGEASLLDFLFHGRTAATLTEALGFEGGVQQDRIVGGPQAVSQRMAVDLADRLILSAPVRRVEPGPAGAVVVSDRGRFDAGAVVVAMSPLLASRIDFDPPLPSLRDGLAQRMPHGSVIKLQVVYPTPFWRHAGLSGTAFSTDGAISFMTDNSPADGHRGVIVGFIEGVAARGLSGAPSAKRRDAIIASLVRTFGPEAAQTDHVFELDWSLEPWTRGCYSGHMAPGGWTAFGPALREPIGPIHWAGTETATWMNGYIDGAVASGERAAAEILGAT